MLRHTGLTRPRDLTLPWCTRLLGAQHNNILSQPDQDRHCSKLLCPPEGPPDVPAATVVYTHRVYSYQRHILLKHILSLFRRTDTFLFDGRYCPVEVLGREGFCGREGVRWAVADGRWLACLFLARIHTQTHHTHLQGQVLSC